MAKIAVLITEHCEGVKIEFDTHIVSFIMPKDQAIEFALTLLKCAGADMEMKFTPAVKN
jgi:hypothetical protein